jgi:hypothetical protein
MDDSQKKQVLQLLNIPSLALLKNPPLGRKMLMRGHLQFKKLVILHHHRLQDVVSETKFCV